MPNALHIEHPVHKLRRFFDLKLGYALMRDRRVPLLAKLLAFALAIGITAAVEILEIPVDGLFAALLPILGIAGDIAFDGIELIIGPLLLPFVLLPWLAPAALVEKIRAERSSRNSGSPPEGPIIDI